jgi:hypothetical protein
MSISIKERAIVRSSVAIGLAALVTGVVLAVAAAAHADSKPVGALPAGPVSTVTTAPQQLVAVAMPRGTKQSGLVWRLARRYNANVVREVSEANVGRNVVVVFRVIGRGDTSLIFALTRGDTSSKAIKTLRHKIHSR